MRICKPAPSTVRARKLAKQRAVYVIILTRKIPNLVMSPNLTGWQSGDGIAQTIKRSATIRAVNRGPVP
jgi:hypothetical protein